METVGEEEEEATLAMNLLINFGSESQTADRTTSKLLVFSRNTRRLVEEDREIRQGRPDGLVA